MNKHTKKILAGILSLLMLASCAPHNKSLKNFQNAENNKNAYQMSVHEKNQSDGGLWVSGDEIKFNKDNKDVAWLQHKTLLVSAEPMSFKEVVSYMQSYGEGVIMTATPDAAIMINNGGKTQASSSGASSSASLGGSVSGLRQELKPLNMQISGSFANLFDSIASQMNVSWRVVGDHHAEFYRFIEKEFNISSIQNISNIKTGQDSGAGYSATNSLSADTWKDLQSVVTGILSSEGSATFSPSLGLIIVRDIPSNVARVSTIIGNINKLMSKQILIDLNMVRYRSTEGSEAAADLALAFKAAGASLGITSIGGTVLGSGTASAAIISPASHLNGSQATLAALQTTGHTSVVVHRSVIAANNTSVPFVLKSTATYLASIGGGSVSNGVATAPTVTPGTTESSINIFVYPRIISGNRIMMQVGIKVKSTDSIRRITTGTGANTNTIEAPNTSDVSFEQTMFLDDGATLMLSGSDLKSSNKTNKLGILGSSFKDAGDDDELVLMITPYIVE